MKKVLEVENISKSYRTYKKELFRVLSWFGIKTKAISENYTLKNISFSLSSGEAIGLIGQNGAGKSTLLKIITGTLHQSEGKIKINGSIAAILELGMGFHPDLTGRQNTYHSIGLMGYSKKQIDEVIEEIQEFAEIGDYFDKPVRVYSSGMQARVSFAIATAFRPDILIVDEALSVGDIYFQHKSFEKIKKYQKEGTTLLFVSHDKTAVLALCNRAILLNQGEILKDGNPEEVTDYYNALLAQKENKYKIKQEKTATGKVQTISGSGEATIEEVTLYNKAGEIVEAVNVAEELTLKIKVKINEDIPSLVLGYAIKDRYGQVIFGTNTWNYKQTIENPRKDAIYIISIEFKANFSEAEYYITLALHGDKTHISNNYEWRDLATSFEVINMDKNIFSGLVWQETNISIKEYKYV